MISNRALAVAFAGLALTVATALADGPDLRDRMQVISPHPNWPKETKDLKAGAWYEIKITGAGGRDMKNRTAIVAVTDEAIHLEVEGGSTQGFVQGLVVKRSSGEVQKALAGKKGEKPKEVKVLSLTPPEPPETKTEDEEVTVAGGTFKAKKTTTKIGDTESVSWVGAEGDAKGILLKLADGSGGGYELKAAPKVEDWKNGGTTYKARHVVYSTGNEAWWIAEHVPLAGTANGTLVRSITNGTTMDLSFGTDAKPVLDWK